MGNNKNKRNHNSNRRLTIKLFIVGTMITLGVGIPSLYFAMNPPFDRLIEIMDNRFPIEKQSDIENKYPEGEFGNRYTSLEAGFTVEKPNEKWDLISDVNAYRKLEGRNVPESIVDAVEFQRHGFVNIVVSVQKPITEGDKKLTVSQWFDLAIFLRTVRDNVNVEPLKTHISPEGDYGYTTFIETENGSKFYHYETVRFYNDQFYSFHISSILPDKLPNDVVQEIDYIFNSYKILS